MFADERRNVIINMLQSQGSVSVACLTERFGISIETVRRDLSFLEQKGVLTRVHGGAISNKGMNKSLQYTQRLTENRAEKRALCSTAMQFIQNDDTIVLECGTTAIDLAELMAERMQRLTVVTNSTQAADILAQNEGIQIILAGGRYDASEKAVVGYRAAESILSFHAEKAFIFPAAINARDGVCACAEKFVQMHRAMMRCADRTFLLADGSKLGKSAFYKVCPLDKQMTVVTDGQADEAVCRLLRKAGVQLVK